MAITQDESRSYDSPALSRLTAINEAFDPSDFIKSSRRTYLMADPVTPHLHLIEEGDYDALFDLGDVLCYGAHYFQSGDEVVAHLEKLAEAVFNEDKGPALVRPVTSLVCGKTYIDSESAIGYDDRCLPMEVSEFSTKHLRFHDSMRWGWVRQDEPILDADTLFLVAAAYKTWVSAINLTPSRQEQIVLETELRDALPNGQGRFPSSAMEQGFLRVAVAAINGIADDAIRRSTSLKLLEQTCSRFLALEVDVDKGLSTFSPAREHRELNVFLDFVEQAMSDNELAKEVVAAWSDGFDPVLRKAIKNPTNFRMPMGFRRHGEWIGLRRFIFWKLFPKAKDVGFDPAIKAPGERINASYAERYKLK